MMPKNPSAWPSAQSFLLLLALSGLSGCMGGHAGPDAEDVQDKMAEYHNPDDYSPGHNLAVIPEVSEEWHEGHTALQTRFISPQGAGPYPVVIYLPGMGEGADAGIQWREAWAKAGFAVLSM